MPDDADDDAAVSAGEAAVDVAALSEGAVAVACGSDATEPPDTTRPWSSITATLAKVVVIPNTALNASACAPVFAG